MIRLIIDGVSVDIENLTDEQLEQILDKNHNKVNGYSIRKQEKKKGRKVKK